MAYSPANADAANTYRRRFSIIGSLGKSLSTSLSRSFTTGSYGRNSFTRDNFIDAYNFHLGARSPVTAASPARDLAHFAGLEDRFCKDFFCCGMNLGNLHDLLQHFEECHVRVESDVDDDEDLPFEFESMDEMDTDLSDGDSVVSTAQQTFADIYLKSQLLQNQANQTQQAVNLSDIYSDDYRISNRSGPAASAFDTSIIRKRMPSGPTSTRVKKIKSSSSDSQPTLPFSSDGPTHMVTDMDIDEPAAAATPSPPPTASAISTRTSPARTIATPSTLKTPPKPSISQQKAQHTQQSQQQPQSQQTPHQQSIAAFTPLPTPNRCTTPLSTALPLPPLSVPQVPLSLAAAFESSIAPTAAAAAPMFTSMETTTAPTSTVSMSQPPQEFKDDRPYKCKVHGCTKAYKNPGGLKYHMQHGHCEDTGDPEMNNIIHKPYQCTVPDCGKRYKNLNGLKYHIEHAHISLLGAC
ncbi:hypothetical protein HDU85_004954 [Gaertneriomyces sp. JEL0708]|nr:hypothetical protein HDU85_004954 [Gaertneriomyces sp. JEL0708]